VTIVPRQSYEPINDTAGVEFVSPKGLHPSLPAAQEAAAATTPPSEPAAAATAAATTPSPEQWKQRQQRKSEQHASAVLRIIRCWFSLLLCVDLG